MMRFLLIILLSISFHARGEITFDSLFRESTFIVGGRIIDQKISTSHDPKHAWQCTLTLVVVHAGAGGLLTVDSIRHYYPGDTLRGLSYFADSQKDTLPRSDYFVVPLKADLNDRKKLSLVCTDSRKGIFTEEELLYASCPVFLYFIQPGQVNTVYVSEKRGWHSFTSYNKYNNMVSFDSRKRRSDVVTIMLSREYNEEGKITDRRRYRSMDHDGRHKTVIWKFREDGRICLKRRVIVTARF